LNAIALDAGGHKRNGDAGAREEVQLQRNRCNGRNLDVAPAALS
jgi:hypothetical protein